MLQNLGDKLKRHRWLGMLVLGSLALIFAVWGAYGVVNIGFGAPTYGLKVNGDRISTQTVSRAWQNQQARYAQALGGASMPAAQKALMQQQLIEQFVRQTLMRQAAERDGFHVSDADIDNAYHSEAAFQVDGHFDQNAARVMLMQAGVSAATYESEKREELLIDQLSSGLQESDFLTPLEVAKVYTLDNQQRELRYAMLPADKYSAAVAVDDAKIKAWYDAHAKEYQSEESVHVHYGELSLATIAATLTIDPKDLAAYFEQQKSHYAAAEQRHAHHILIPIDAPKDAKAEAAALAKAQDVLAQLKAGKDFGELAKKYSADPGSAAQGGDLGFAGRSAYVAPFADALFKLKPGEVSEPVKTQFGYHLIRLDEIRASETKTLENDRAEIEANYRHDKAAEIFGDRQEQLQQKLESGTTDFDALVKEFQLTTGDVDTFTRTGGGAPLGAKPELIQAVFADDVVGGQRIGGPVGLAEDQIIVFKDANHQLPAPRPLAAVREQVIAAIRRSEGAQAAKAAADTAIKALQSGGTFDAVVAGLGTTAAPAAFYARSDTKLPAPVRESAFSAPPPAAGKPQYRSVALADGGAALIAVSAMKAGVGGTDPEAGKIPTQHLHRDREGEMAAYLADKQAHASIQTNPAVFE